MTNVLHISFALILNIYHCYASLISHDYIIIRSGDASLSKLFFFFFGKRSLSKLDQGKSKPFNTQYCSTSSLVTKIILSTEAWIQWSP